MILGNLVLLILSVITVIKAVRGVYIAHEKAGEIEGINSTDASEEL